MLTAAMASFVLSPALVSTGQETPRPRAGLTAIQTKDAVRIAGGSLAEIRKKDEATKRSDGDRREYVVAVERLTDKNLVEGAEAPARAVVTTYRYLDDTTVYATVDLTSGRTVDVKTVQHMQTPLSDGEFEAAKALARERSEEIKALADRFGKRLEVYAQFSQYTPDGDDRVHRVVHLLYRVDKRDLSAPRPVVDLTTREVRVPKPEAVDDTGEVRPVRKK